jgi:hypothetical protein
VAEKITVCTVKREREKERKIERKRSTMYGILLNKEMNP